MGIIVDGHRMVAGMLLLTSIVAATTSLAGADENSAARTSTRDISLFELPDVGRTTHVKYTLQIKGKLTTPATTGTTDWDLNSSATFEFDQRRFPSDADGPFALRAARLFQTAETSSLVGKDHKNTVILPSQSRLIHIHGGELQLIQLSPEVRLTRPQVDLLQFPCDPLAVTGLLPGRSLKDKSEKWNADSWVVPMLSGIDASVTQTASCTLKSLNDTEAVIVFDCNGTGAITGSPTEVSLKGEMIVNRKESLIRRLKATMTEKRGPGTVSPGLDVTAEIQWTQEIASPAAALPDMLP
jgi:hypothetical protein